MLRILVTGANGFVGRHLIRELDSRGLEIIGVGHGGGLEPEVGNRLLEYRQCDLSDPKSVAELPLEGIDAVINLAGLAATGKSFEEAEKYRHINVAMLNVPGERLLEINPKARVVAVSSGAVYASDQPLPLTEASRTTTEGSPYAQSKLLMEQAAEELRKKGLDCIVARPFNHAGPGQGPGFLIPDLYRKLAAVAKSGGPLLTGNLKSKRDYTDVRDVVKAYVDLAVAETLEYDLYNICSGASRSGQEILDMFLRLMNLEGKVEAETDESLIRPNDPPELYGSRDRITEETGWEPAIPLDRTLADFIASQKP